MTFTFQQQAEYFKKKLNIPTNSYLDVIGEEHDYFFMVAGASRNEVLLALREAVDKAIAGGTIEEFRQQFDDIVAKTGWQYKGGRNWRTRIIYDTNVYGSYNRARLQQHLDLADVMPYWEYQHNDNAHPRQEHVDLDGIIRPATDPFWKYYYPIKAYGCHCTVIAHDEDDLEMEGKKVSPPVEIEMVEKVAGVRSGNPQKFTLPKGYDVGFQPHNFERLTESRNVNVDKLLFQKFTNADPHFASALADNVLQNPKAVAMLNASMAKMVDDVVGGNIKTADNFKYVGVIPRDVITKLDDLGIKPQSAVIGIDKGNIVHAVRELKQNANIAIPLDFWRQLPEKLRNPTAILLDKAQKTPTLLFVYKTEQGKIAVKLDYDAKINGKKVSVNLVRTGSLIEQTKEWGNLKNSYNLLWGSLD